MKRKSLMIVFHAWLFSGLLTLGTSVAHAQALSGLALYARCYAHLTGRALPLNHPLRAGLKNGSVDAVSSCKALLAKGQIDPTTHQVNTSDPEAVAVLQTMFAFHRTWFTATDFIHMQGYGANGTLDLYDAAEPALALTSVMFAQGADAEEYRQIFKESHGFYPIRQLTPALNALVTGHTGTLLPSRIEQEYGALKNSLPEVTTRIPGVGWNNTATNSGMLSFTPIYVGELIGIQHDSRTAVLSDYYSHELLNSGVTVGLPIYNDDASLRGMVYPLDALQRNGGGVLGSPAFMLLNWGHPPGQEIDGALKMPRRWVKAALDSLLCKQLPILREVDVTQFLDLSTVPNKAPFREGTTCLQCHATMDQFAMVGRNFQVADTDYSSRVDAATGYNIKVAHLMGRTTASLPDPHVWSSTPIANYRKTTASGRLFFRDFSGKLVDQPISSIQQAGDILAESDDFYQCAAKRYFQYFTGYNVPLYDRGDPRYAASLASITPQERQLRLYIEQLGTQLKTQQSSKKLIETILSSPYYSDLNNLAGTP